MRVRGVTIGNGNPTPKQVENEVNKALNNIANGDFEEVEL